MPVFKQQMDTNPAGQQLQSITYTKLVTNSVTNQGESITHCQILSKGLTGALPIVVNSSVISLALSNRSIKDETAPTGLIV